MSLDTPPNRVSLLGLGLTPEHLPPGARQRLDQAQVLVAGRAILERLDHQTAESIPVTSPLEDVFAAIRQRLDQGLRVVAVASGDPLFFGLGRRLLDALGPDRVDVLPGVSTIQAAAARLKTPWDDIAPVSLHGRGGVDDALAALAFTPRVAAFTDARNTPRELAQALLERGADQAVNLTVCEDLHLPTERIRTFAPTQAARTDDFSPLNLTLLERIKAPQVRLRLGMADSELAHDGNHTKAGVRAAAVAALDLAPEHTLWDLGAGCGTVSVTAASQLPRGRVVAVEHKPRRLEFTRENIRRTQAFHVRVVDGSVTDPDLLAALPAPDRVFIGGGLSGRCGEPLHTVCRRLPQGGTVVVSAILLGTLEYARNQLAQNGFGVSLAQLSHAASGPLGAGIRLTAENPIFLIQGTKL